MQQSAEPASADATLYRVITRRHEHLRFHRFVLQYEYVRDVFALTVYTYPMQQILVMSQPVNLFCAQHT